MRLELEPIVACITGNQSVPVGIVRVSGVGAHDCLRHVFEVLPERPEPRRLYYGRFSNDDEGFAVLFDSDRSYTGEESAEAMIHGSVASVRSLIEALVAAGARPARPGEFTERAFLHGRVDLAQAEGVRASIEAQTDRQMALANAWRSGILSQAIESISARVGRLLAEIEAHTDFSEELGEYDRGAGSVQLQALSSELGQLIDASATVRLIQEGLRIAIVGRPNAGKSSLLNAVVGHNRAITSPVPGTTRDYVEVEVDHDGFKLVLVDTAGLREAEGDAEAEGIARAREIARSADAAWFLFDASQGWTDEDERQLASLGAQVRRVATKADLRNSGDVAPSISSKTWEGIRELLDREVERLRELPTAPVGVRHAESVRRARIAIQAAQATMDSVRPLDLVASDLRHALDSLGEILGESVGADLIESIFRDFCVGK